jgi:K+-dependent Na+/Ca+ exchanger-like protein
MVTLVFFIIGVVLLIFGADFLVRGSSKLAISVGISPLVVGLTVVAFGTSSPELAVLLQASFTGKADIALGNVIGSNICNVLIVLGLTALIAPMTVSRQLIKFDVPVMIGVSFLLLLFGLDGQIGQVDGAILFTGIIAYTGWSIQKSRKQNMDVVKVQVFVKEDVRQFSRLDSDSLLETLVEVLHIKRDHITMLPVAGNSKALTMELPAAAAEHLKHSYKEHPELQKFAITNVDIVDMAEIIIHIEEDTQTFTKDEQEGLIIVIAEKVKISPDLVRMLPVNKKSNKFTLEMPKEAGHTLIDLYEKNDLDFQKLRFLKIERQKMAWLGQVGLIVLGLAMLVLGARWLVDGAIAFALWLGISELIVGLTIVAVGTSLPEIATSVVAGMRGEGDIVAGNVVGSNIFNILLVLGLSSIIAPVAVSQSALYGDIPVMILVALICFPVFFTGNKIVRWEGALFTGYYVAYTLYLVLQSTGSSLLPLFLNVMLVVVPASVLLLFVLMIKSFLANRVPHTV